MTELDYWGIRLGCGCISAWLAAPATEAEERDFQRRMTSTGRVVQRMAWSEELRERLNPCPHVDRPSTRKQQP